MVYLVIFNKIVQIKIKVIKYDQDTLQTNSRHHEEKVNAKISHMT